MRPIRAVGDPKVLWSPESSIGSNASPKISTETPSLEDTSKNGVDASRFDWVCVSCAWYLQAIISIKMLAPDEGTPQPRKRRKLNISGLTPPPPSTSSTAGVRRTIINQIQQVDAYRTLKMINTNRFIYAVPPPTTTSLLHSLSKYNLPSKNYRAPYYSVAEDVPDKTREYAGLIFQITGGHGISYLEDWHRTDQADSEPSHEDTHPLQCIAVEGWEYASSPPSPKQIKQWLIWKGREKRPAHHLKEQSQVKLSFTICDTYLTFHGADRRSYSGKHIRPQK
jgi:hypothetical protein